MLFILLALTYILSMLKFDMFNAYKYITEKMSQARKDRFDKKLRINIGKEENDDNYFDNEHWEQRGALLLRGVKPDGLHGDDIVLKRKHPLLNNFAIEYKRNKAKTTKEKDKIQIDIPLSHKDTSDKYDPGGIIMHSFIDKNTNLVLCDCLYVIKSNIVEKREKHWQEIQNKKHGEAQKYKITNGNLELLDVIYLNEIYGNKISKGQTLMKKIIDKWNSYTIQKVKRNSKQIDKTLLKTVYNIFL